MIEENWIKVSDDYGGTYNKPDNILINEKESATTEVTTEATVTEEGSVETNQTAKSIA